MIMIRTQGVLIVTVIYTRRNASGGEMLMQRQNCLCVEEALCVVTYVGVFLRSDDRNKNI